MLKKIAQKLTYLYYKYTDPYQLVDLKTTPIIPRKIVEKGLIPKREKIRLFEVGPRWGQDARDWDKRLGSINEMVFLDLPDIKPSIDMWLPEIRAKNRVVYANIMRMRREQLEELGKFDIVYCAGVVYHIAEQLRFIKILFDRVAEGGLLVIESFVGLHDENIVRIHWPETSHKMLCHHEPSRGAIMAWLEMVGFVDIVEHRDIYPKKFKKRTVITAVKDNDARTPNYLSLQDYEDANDFSENAKVEVLGTEVEYIKINYLP